MSFFDQKEDVLKIELTPFGKQLLSKGQFKPEYYAFFDDDVIYDGAFLGIAEEQNNTETRILENSIYVKPQPTAVSRFGTATQLPEHSVSDKAKVLNNTEVKEKILPLGNSKIGNNNYPSWEINFLNGDIKNVSGSTNYNNTTSNVNIPQINLQTTYYKVDSVQNTRSNFSFNNPTSNIELEDGTIIAIQEDFISIEVLENNSYDTKDNFEIEMFLVEGDETADGINLQKLKFFEKPNNVIDGMIFDESEMPKTEEMPDLDPTYVQHYFDILVDKSITKKVEKPVILNTDRVYRSTAIEPFGEDC